MMTDMTTQYLITNPKTGKTYTYGEARKADAEALALKLGAPLITYRKTYAKRPARQHFGKLCICGRPEDNHEAYDCHKDYDLAGGW